MGAIELDGKPLKFTAEFDSKEAEQNLDSFLNKIKNLNSQSIGKNSSASQSGQQFQSILDDATQSFNAFNAANKDFYSNIARSEMGLQRVKQEQNLLNKELRDGTINEQEYINRTSQLNAVKENLSKQIKENKDQLKAFNDEAKRTTPFTKQDTKNEIKSAFNPGNGIPSLNASDSLAKQSQNSLNEYGLQIDNLKKKLNDGTISNEKYAKSVQDIEAKIKSVKENLNYASFNIEPPPAIVEPKPQKGVLDSISKEYKNIVQDAEGAFSSLDPKVKELTETLFNSRKELKDLGSAQKELDALYKSGKITQEQYITSTRDLSVQQSGVKSRIAETSKELKNLETLERQSVGSISEKTAKLTQLRERYINLSDAQRKNVAVGGQIEKEYQQISKEVDKLNAKLNGTKSGGIAGVFNGLRGIAATLGIAFGTAQLISFGKELFDLARKSEGVKNAFNSMSTNSSSNLETLRAATKGTVSDFELMRVAVRANNFKIPMESLAKGLAFAKQRSDETGESVDYLVNSFVNGIGRKSTLVMDNLGISASELQEEIKKTGDFAEAAGNLIERSMKNAGYTVDTFGNRVSQAAAYWDNMKLKASGFIADLFVELTELVKSDTWNEFWNRMSNWGNGRNVTIAKNLKKDVGEVESFLKNKNLSFSSLFGDDKTVNDDLRKSYKAMVGDALKMRKQAEGAYNELLAKRNDKNFIVTNEDINRYKTAYENANKYYNSLSKFKDKYGEVYSGPIRDTKSIKELKEELKELEGEKELLTNKAQIVEKEKQISAKRKEIADLDGSASKKDKKKSDSDAKRLNAELERDENEHLKLLDKWAQVDADFSDKQLSKDEREVASVRKKYADIKKEIEKFNKTTKGKKISLVGFDDSVKTAVDNIKERQANDDKLKLYKEDYENYVKYESVKKEHGDLIAYEQLGKYKYIFENIQKEYSDLANKSIGDLSANDKDYMDELAKIIESHNKKINDERLKDYLSALDIAKTYNDKILDNEKDFQNKLKALKDNGRLTPQRQKVLEKERDDNSSRIAVDELTSSDVWTVLFEDLDSLTAKQIDKMLVEIQSKFSQLKVKFNPIDLDNIQKKLLEAKRVLIKDNPFKQVGQAIKDIMENAGDDSVEGAKKTKRAWTDLSKSTQGAFDFVNDAISSAEFLKDAIGEVGTTALMSLMAVSSTAIAVAAAIKTAEKASVVLAIIQAALVVVQAIAGLFKSIFAAGDKRLEKSIQSKKEAVEQLDRAFQKLGRSIDRSIGNSYYTDSQKQIENLKEQAELIKQMQADEEAKKKTDKSKIQEFNDQLEDIQFKIEDIQQNIIDNLVQTTFKDFANTLGDALVSAFEAGENALDSLNKTFDQFIKDAVVNSLKMTILQKPIDEMIKSVSDYMKGNDFSLNGFDFSQWRDKLGSAGKDFTKALEDAYKGLGISNLNSGSGLKSSIQRELTEAGASELTGVIRSSYEIDKKIFEEIKLHKDIMSRQLVLSSDSLTTLNAIEYNTGETVKRLDLAVDHLGKLVKNTTQQSNRAYGG